MTALLYDSSVNCSDSNTQKPAGAWHRLKYAFPLPHVWAQPSCICVCSWLDRYVQQAWLVARMLAGITGVYPTCVTHSSHIHDFSHAPTPRHASGQCPRLRSGRKDALTEMPSTFT
jgi:hypothetical protein